MIGFFQTFASEIGLKPFFYPLSIHTVKHSEIYF